MEEESNPTATAPAPVDEVSNGNGNHHDGDNGVDMDETEKIISTPAPAAPKVPWRKPGMDLKDHLFHVLDQGIMTDMTFLVGEEKDGIPAHRFVLTLWSKVFEEMPDTVEIPEMNVAAIKSILKFLYTEEFEVSGEDLMPVLCAAKRFEIPALTAKCVAALKCEINAATAVGMFQAAKLLGEEALSEESLNYILKHGGQVLKEDDFLRLSYENLCYFLERDDFEVEEVQLFKAVFRWANHACREEELEQTPVNLRFVLKEAVKLIRFPLISSKDFAVHVANTGILQDKEMISLLIQYSIPASDRVNLPLTAHGFIDRPRKFVQQPSKKRARKDSVGSVPDAKHPKLVTLDGEDMDTESGVNGTSAEDWRNPHAGFKFNLMKMFQHHYNSDVTFVVGDAKEKVFAHRFILALWSSAFEKLFEAKGEDQEPLEMLNTDAVGFRSFLKVLYTDNFDVSVENMMSVFYIAKQYDIPLLGDKCVKLLKTNIGDNTAISIFQAAKGMGDDKLADSAWSYILSRGFAIVKESDFLNMNYSNLCALLEQDELEVGETELFQSVLRWASQQCDKDGIPKIPENLRMVLKKAISLIRFPLMPIQDFSLHVAPTELLTDKELVGVFAFHSLPPSERTNAYNLTFNAHERKSKTVAIKQRIPLCNLSIKSDRPISIHGFSFSGLDLKKMDYFPSSIYLYNSKQGISHATSYTETVVSNEGRRRFSVKFKLPITVRPNEWYISSEMSVGRQGEVPVKNETWVSVRSRQADINFQFQVQPLKQANGIFDYAIPEVIFRTL